MSNVRNPIGARSLSRGANTAPEEIGSVDSARPLSLQMGPTVIWLNALGNKEAKAMTEAWRPRFTITTVVTIEGSSWQ